MTNIQQHCLSLFYIFLASIFNGNLLALPNLMQMHTPGDLEDTGNSVFEIIVSINKHIET